MKRRTREDFIGCPAIVPPRPERDEGVIGCPGIVPMSDGYEELETTSLSLDNLRTGIDYAKRHGFNMPEYLD